MLQNNPLAYYVTYLLGFQPALTQTTKAEQVCLASFAQGKRILVEIGVWHGVNTRLFRQVMHPNGRLYAVDPFFKGRFGVSWEKKIALRETAKSRNGELHILELLSEDAAQAFDEIESSPVEFLFVDGDHSFEAVRKDWLGWSGKVAPGGIAALHDSQSYLGRSINDLGSARFMREHIANDTRFDTVQICDSLTVLRRART